MGRVKSLCLNIVETNKTPWVGLEFRYLIFADVTLSVPTSGKKIGTQCVHVASQDRILIKHNKTINAMLFLFFTIPTMQVLDVV